MVISPVMDYNKRGVVKFDEDLLLWEKKGFENNRPKIKDYVFIDSTGDFVRKGYVAKYKGIRVLADTRGAAIEGIFMIMKNKNIVH